MKILSGTSNPKLSKEISKLLKLKLVNTNIKRFSDGEIYIEINENIRGNSVFVIQSTSDPANDNLMELLLCIDALEGLQQKYYCSNSLLWLCQTRQKGCAENFNFSKSCS